jgi:hypothetical protein
VLDNPAIRQEIALEFRRRMTAWAGAVATGRSSNLQKRRQLDAEMRRLAKTHKIIQRDEEMIEYHRQLAPQMQRLQAEIDALPNHRTVSIRRPRGIRARFIRELANEYSVSERVIADCLREF